MPRFLAKIPFLVLPFLVASCALFINLFGTGIIFQIDNANQYYRYCDLGNVFWYFDRMAFCICIIIFTISRKKQPGQLYGIMLDVNDFKIINDTYGHLAGDRSISAIGHILVNSVDNAMYAAKQQYLLFQFV